MYETIRTLSDSSQLIEDQRQFALRAAEICQIAGGDKLRIKPYTSPQLPWFSALPADLRHQILSQMGIFFKFAVRRSVKASR